MSTPSRPITTPSGSREAISAIPSTAPTITFPRTMITNRSSRSINEGGDCDHGVAALARRGVQRRNPTTMPRTWITRLIAPSQVAHRAVDRSAHREQHHGDEAGDGGGHRTRGWAGSWRPVRNHRITSTRPFAAYASANPVEPRPERPR